MIKFNASDKAIDVAKRIAGRTIEIVGARAGHATAIGSRIKMDNNIPTHYQNGTNSTITIRNSNGVSVNVYLTDIALVEETLDELVAEITMMEKSIALIQGKINYLKETGSSLFDETEFKVWNTLQILKTKKTDIEKAKVIAQLINS